MQSFASLFCPGTFRNMPEIVTIYLTFNINKFDVYTIDKAGDWDFYVRISKCAVKDESKKRNENIAFTFHIINYTKVYY